MENGIRTLLNSFPTNYPVDNVIVNGRSVATTNFINVQGDLAFFRNNAETRIFRIESIDGLDF
ncbi:MULTISPECIES: hypothetical protein [Bacillus cereus group]|uniref:Uncharacterized protein n=2 Tax=Bacillus cereus group TaxID=86661 RepID=A0A9W5K304_BACC8|nr:MULTISPECIES: hypothetical protein [Bacillus cereus group]AMR05940.1 hypothetical protein AXW78_28045 [Bacillus thuringiensis]AYF85345.1 hypothetical protein D7J84_30695 [Bacillus thuringiensis]EEM80528.1 hypothetical protein bthur0011_54900 [Bacillus thuringiensis serovar huazhongensis BGSC 4BD1]EJR14842.1 hypothetical protein IIA_05340 [Bacillus cereus VD014]EJR74771.1 hypothetical protein IK7_05559 [Bacillus cereus VD156]